MSTQGHKTEVGKLTYFAQDKNEEHRRIGINLSDRLIGIAQPDRQLPFYILGQGDASSGMMLNMARQDIQAGRGVAVFDPLGNISESLLRYIPKHRQNDVIYIKASDVERPVAVNLLQQGEPSVVGNNLVSSFHDLWRDSWGPNLEYVLRNSLLALAESPATTLLHVSQMLVDGDFRDHIVKHVKNPVVRMFWQKEFPSYRKRPERIMPVQNRIGAFASQPILRNILGQAKSTIKFDRVIKDQSVLIVNLAKANLGPTVTNLLGSLLLSGLQQAIMAQASRAPHEQREFSLYIPDCHNLVTRAFTSLLSETKSYKINVVLSHQYLGQLEKGIRESIIGSAGTLVCFRLGPEDAKELELQFAPDFNAIDLLNLSENQIYYKLVKNGRVDRAEVSRVLFPPRVHNHREYQEKIIRKSRRRYGRNREKVEQSIEQSLNLYGWLHQAGYR